MVITGSEIFDSQQPTHVKGAQVMAPNSYSLTVINNSELPRPTIAVFAVLPADSSYDTLALAWLTQPINHGNKYTFTWEIVWGFCWGATGTNPGDQWIGSGQQPADPTSEALCAVDFSYNGDFLFIPSATKPTGNHLYIQDDSSIPLPSTQPSSVGVTLNGSPVCVTNAGPNLKQTFTLHPTYFIDAGNYVPEQMVDGDSVTTFEAIRYTEGNTALTVTLNRDNTWTNPA
jgi:hypothetical protein